MRAAVVEECGRPPAVGSVPRPLAGAGDVLMSVTCAPDHPARPAVRLRRVLLRRARAAVRARRAGRRRRSRRIAGVVPHLGRDGARRREPGRGLRRARHRSGTGARRMRRCGGRFPGTLRRRGVDGSDVARTVGARRAAWSSSARAGRWARWPCGPPACWEPGPWSASPGCPGTDASRWNPCRRWPPRLRDVVGQADVVIDPVFGEARCRRRVGARPRGPAGEPGRVGGRLGGVLVVAAAGARGVGAGILEQRAERLGTGRSPGDHLRVRGFGDLSVDHYVVGLDDVGEAWESTRRERAVVRVTEVPSAVRGAVRCKRSGGG